MAKTDPTAADAAEEVPSVHAEQAAALVDARQLAPPATVLSAVEASNYERAQADYQPIAEGE